MASTHKRTRSDGSIAHQVRWRENGRAASTTAPTAAAAKRIKAIVEATGTYNDELGRVGVPTVTEQAEVYLATGTRGNAATVEGYRRIVARHIEPTFGVVPLTALTVPMLTVWGNALPGSAKTQQNITAVMHGILATAVPDVLPANPWTRVRLEPRRVPRKRHRLEPEDLRLIIDELPEHYRPLILILAFTGIRWGEAAALTVGDVTRRGGSVTLAIEKAIKHRARQTDEPGVPKTARSERMVDVPTELVPVILPLLEREAGAPLFPAERGGRVRNSPFHTLVWQPALNRAQDRGLSWRPRIHDLRAAATSWMIDSGMDITDVADVMGHESIETTFAIYRRVNPKARRHAARAMGDVLAEVTRPAMGAVLEQVSQAAIDA